MGTGPWEGADRDPRSAIREREILCLVCGRALRQLTNTHLRAHRLTADAYRRAFGYNRRTALMARELRALYRDRAVRLGLAARIRENPLRRDPGLAVQGSKRQMRLEEQLNRREAARRAAPLREARFREAGRHPRTKPVDPPSSVPSCWQVSPCGRSPGGSGSPLSRSRRVSGSWPRRI